MSKVVNAAKWSTLGQAVRLVLKIGFSIVLAKLLSPVEFGLMAKVSILLSILNAIANFGLSASLIQRREVKEEDFSSVFWVNIISGTALSLILFLTSDLIALFYSTPELRLITQVLSVTLLFNSFTLVQQAILIKNLKFKQLEIYISISTFLSAAIGLYMASKHFGVWSLVFQSISSSVFLASLLWSFESWRPSFTLNRTSIKQMSGFGGSLAGSNLLDILFSNLDSILIGKYFSTLTMGYYSYSQTLIKTVFSTITGPLLKVLFPTLANLQVEDERAKTTYRKFVTFSNFIMIPVMLFILIMADEIVAVLLNEKWKGISLYLKYFAAIGILYNHCAINVISLTARGKGGLFFRLEILKKTLLCFCLFTGFQFGIQGMMKSVLISWVANLPIDVYFSGRVSKYTWLEQLKDFAPNLVIALLYVLSLYTLRDYFYSIRSTFPGLTLIGCFSVAIYLTLSYLFKAEGFSLSLQLSKKLIKD